MKYSIFAIFFAVSFLHGAAHENIQAGLSEKQDPLVAELFSAAARIGFDFSDENQETINRVCNAGAPIDSQNSEGQTPLLVAASRGNTPAVLETLLYRNANPTVVDTMRNTPLHLAAACPYDWQIKELLQSEKIDVNATNDAGMTPLEIAINHENGDVGKVKALMLDQRVVLPHDFFKHAPHNLRYAFALTAAVECGRVVFLQKKLLGRIT